MSTDGGDTWTAPFGNQAPNVRTLLPIDHDRVLFASELDWMRISDPAASVPDYVLNTTDWDQGASAFGGCLQDVGGIAAGAGWTEDPSGRCDTVDGDP